MVDADRAKWDYHPMMAGGFKAGQGLFYQIASSKDFRGMVSLMKRYVKTRAAWIDANLLTDTAIPATPSVHYTGPVNFPAGRLSFQCAEFSGAGGFAAMKWRVGEIVSPTSADHKLAAPQPYEITPVWESAELSAFNPEMNVPPGSVKAGHSYRLRARMKDVTGRWSHWSAPVEFVAGQ